jgi:hypothetical protein
MKFGNRFISTACPCAIAGLAVSTILSSGAIAQVAVTEGGRFVDFPTVGGVPFGQVHNEFTEAYFSHGRDYFASRNLGGQIKWIFGIPAFPENSMKRDARAVFEVYQATMYRQMNSGPIVRTLDLPTPFPASLRTLPPTRVAIPEQAVEPPFFTPPPMARPAPSVPEGPVPALW